MAYQILEAIATNSFGAWTSRGHVKAWGFPPRLPWRGRYVLFTNLATDRDISKQTRGATTL